MAGAAPTGEPPASTPATGASGLLDPPPKAAEVNVTGYAGVLLASSLGVLLSAAAIGSWIYYAYQPEWTPEPGPSASWRITTVAPPTDWRDWKICALIPYIDSLCRGDPIDISSAVITASPAVPDGWKAFNLAASKQGISQTCLSPWEASTDKRRDASDPPYLEWTLPSMTSVGCFKAQYVQLASGKVSKIDPVVIQREQNGTWVETKRRRSLWREGPADIDRIRTGWTAQYQANLRLRPLWVTSVVLTVLAQSTFFVVFPIFWCRALERSGRIALREEVTTGSALVVDCPQSQWAAFVEEEWGRGGVVQGEELAWWMWLIFTLATCLVGVLVLRISVDWGACFCIACPVVIGLMVVAFLGTKLARRIRYDMLRQDCYPVVFGSGALYFADVFVSQRAIFSSDISFSDSVAKYRLTVKYMSGLEGSRLAVPIPEARLHEVKAFLEENAEAYGFTEESDSESEPGREIELAVSKAQPRNEAQEGGVTPSAAGEAEPPSAELEAADGQD